MRFFGANGDRGMLLRANTMKHPADSGYVAGWNGLPVFSSEQRSGAD